jgi:hypothetical protein
MPSRPDLRDIATNVKEAFADADKETLLDVLTFVIKEYVVEGPPPMLMHQAETLSDLQGMSFAQLISALQTRFDHPELAMFVVEGETVGVRIGGVVQQLLPGRTPPTSSPQAVPQGAQPAVEQMRAAGVRVVETQLSPRPPQQAPAQQQGSAPPPVRGLSMRGAPTSSGGGAPAQQPPAQQPPAQQPPAQQGQAQPAAPQEKTDKPEGSGDDASTRFGLLELD